MNFPTAIKTGFRKYWNTEGRASRSEYWYWTLFTVLVSLLLIIPDRLIFHAGYEENGPLNIIFSLATFFPSLFVMIRRLHDVDRSGYWWMISITVIGLIPLLYWMIKKGTVGDNRFGARPLA